jgi:hypothetical protein
MAVDFKQLSLAIIVFVKGGLTRRCSGGRAAQFIRVPAMPLVAPLNAGVGRLARHRR